ncbi:ABC transporter substrate-binding protein [Devosia sp. ZB163]|uniref:ABC transporter substrate-binding protein n=1 Tax=Devosia sp. ZB163 TaxID=3025938 RepID=UPI00236097FC|nr:ABC transporter substrate-binding protein [Devosia sp. ZB163]MDC9825233.1 ABC transporter substrate-binding protein [Devosia sp. ZB163]
MAKRFTLATATALLLLTTAAIAQTEVRFTHSITGGASREALDAIIADFEAANPDIKIKEIVFDDDQYSNQGLITQLKSNEVPDIFFEWAGYPVQRDVEAGYAYDLSEAMATDGWKESFSDAVWTDGAGTMVDGKPYLVPLSLDLTNTIWYNKKIFAEHNLTPPRTWDEFVALNKTLAEAGETPIVEGNNEFWPLGNWAGHIAAMVVPPDAYVAAFKQEAPFNTPEFEKALNLLVGLHEVGAFNKDMQALGADPAMATFFQEGAVMHPIGSWLVSETGNLADEGFEYSQFNTPPIDPAHPLANSVIGTITGLVVHKNAQHPAEAIKFLKFLTSEASQVKWAESGQMSPVQGVSDKAKLDEQTQAMLALMSGASGIVPPPDNKYPVPVAEAFYQAAAFAASGEKSAKDALVWLDETLAAMGKQ